MHALGNYEAVVFDMDGVLTQCMDENGKFKWHKSVEADIGVAPQQIQTFFMGEQFRKCALGQGDITAALQEYLPTTGATVDAKGFLDYWFTQDDFLDENMLKLSSNLRKQDIKTYIATNYDRARADYLWNHYNLSEHFDGMFVSCEVGALKPEAEFFKTVNKNLPVVTNVLFLDDSQKNAEACNVVGWQGYHFQGLEKFSQDFDVAKYQ